MDLLTNFITVIILQYICVLNQVVHLKLTQCSTSIFSLKLEKILRYLTFIPTWSSKSSMYFTVMAHLNLGQLYFKGSGGQWLEFWTTQVQKWRIVVKTPTPNSGDHSRKSSRRNDRTKQQHYYDCRELLSLEKSPVSVGIRCKDIVNTGDFSQGRTTSFRGH